MSGAREQNENVRLYVTTPLDADARQFFLERLEGSEAMSDLFHYTLLLKTFDDAVDFTKIVDQNVTVTILRDEDPPRLINGVVTQFIQTFNDGQVTRYLAEIRPWFWKLTLTQNSQIFQNMTVPDIISQVFSDLGMADFKNSTTKTYAERVYCVQYQETAFNFVSRLMEDVGIFYFFEHTDSAHTLVMADDNDACESCPGAATVQYQVVKPDSDNLLERFHYQEQVVTSKFAVDDYNFETPESDLMTEADSNLTFNLRAYEYPAGFENTGDGETLANRRVDERELPQKVVTGDGYSRAFIAGYKFTLSDHYRQDYNTDYIIRRLEIQVTQESYDNAFEAFPADSLFIPPRLTPKPKIYGTQTALVVGKSGEEIWTDEYGRIKVKFHWDQSDEQNENCSCWIRVAQVWAGKSWGTMFIPRMGAEAVVSFLEGNPDQPLVIGTVYNATQVLPYTQPDNKNRSTILTRSTKEGDAGNEIRFEDTKGSEELYLHAQKDMNTLVENDQTATITQNRTTTVSKANDTLTVDQGDRSVSVNTGNETHKNGADFTHTVSGDYSLTVDGDLTIDVKGNITIKAGSSMTIQSGTGTTVKSGTSMTITASTTLDAEGSASATLKSSGATAVKGSVVQIN